MTVEYEILSVEENGDSTYIQVAYLIDGVIKEKIDHVFSKAGMINGKWKNVIEFHAKELKKNADKSFKFDKKLVGKKVKV